MPDDLAVFDPDAWPGATVTARWSSWRQARRVHAERHGWPGGPLAMIAGEHDVQAVIERSALWSWGRTRDEMVRAADELERRYGRRPALDVPDVGRKEARR